MQIETIKIENLVLYGKNARTHPQKQIDLLAKNIERFGFTVPVLIDANNVIIAGHGRISAMRQLGREEVPCVRMSDLSEDEVKALRLADNQLATMSGWDQEIVVAELKELDMRGFNIELTGFSRSLILQTDEKDDRVPELPAKAKSKLGDLYELGGHKILCGDATNEGDMMRLMGKVKADMLFSDPPYNVNYKGAGKNTSQGIMNDKMGAAQFREFLVDSFKHWPDAVKKGAGLYVFHSPTTQAIFEDALNVTGFEVKYQLIWNKPSAGLGMGDYRNKHEPFFYACLKKADPLFYGDRTNTTIVDFTKTDEQLAKWAKSIKQAEKEGKMTIWTMKREPTQDYVHPTQKPVELIMYALNNSSKVEDVVLDPFLGSGSTMIGCQKTNRFCYGLELDPRFVDVIVQRWCDYTENRNILKNGEKIVW